jgi:hypothetical protein
MTSLYLKEALKVAPRILGSLDRNPASRTRGCFDREYWAWKMKDMPNASLQYGIYFLSLLYSTPDANNPYHGNERVKKWVAEALQYWMDVQHRNGSFDQCYPLEQSVGTTAYTLLAVLHAVDIFSAQWSPEFREAIFVAMKKAAQFFLKHPEKYASITNHSALFAYLALRLNHDFDIPCKRLFQEIMDKIHALQSSDGWHAEYGGSDPGYQTQTIYYLAECYRYTHDEKLHESLSRAVQHMIFCLHPDGSFGGDYGSRNSVLYYPAGFEMLATSIPEALTVAEWMKESLSKQRCLVPDDLDLENAIRLGVNCLVAERACEKAVLPTCSHEWRARLPWNFLGDENKWFDHAQILIRKHLDTYTMFAAGKGGVLQVYDHKKGELLYSDSGYLGKVGPQLVTTQIGQRADVKLTDKSIECFVRLFCISPQKMNVPIFSFLRVVALFVSPFPAFRAFLKRLMVMKLIESPSKKKGVQILRKLTFSDDGMWSHDELFVTNNSCAPKVAAKRSFNSIHMASASYFSKADLSCDESRELDVHNSTSLIGIRST